MIEGKQYVELVNKYFHFLITEFDLILFEEKINGSAFYNVHYRNSEKDISISYENISDYFLVVIFILQDGKLPNYDDKTKTLHLNKLNQFVFPKVDKHQIEVNNYFFSKFEANSDLEKKLLNSAKELRLCLTFFEFWQNSENKS